jgi:hypothetical protein
MVANRETTMSAGEGPSGGGANPEPEMRILDWILSGSNTRESHIYPGLFFYLYWVFYASVQITTFVPVGDINRYTCHLTGVRQILLLPTRYKCLTFVSGGVTTWYSDTPRYKCGDICTG